MQPIVEIFNQFMEILKWLYSYHLFHGQSCCCFCL